MGVLVRRRDPAAAGRDRRGVPPTRDGLVTALREQQVPRRRAPFGELKLEAFAEHPGGHDAAFRVNARRAARPR